MKLAASVAGTPPQSGEDERNGSRAPSRWESLAVHRLT